MPTPLLTPRHLPAALIDTESNFETAVNEILAGTGPIAIDAERASGYRYSQRAYLIQIFRRGGGLHLIDPIPLKQSENANKLIEQLNSALSSEEWVIHASTQDLPCLREFGISPKKLFDTELGARLAGCPRVGLGPLTESLLDLTLAKEHSAVDWSKRPLHVDWLNYAALDVDVLLDLRDCIAALLEVQGKLEWARADFANILTAQLPMPRKDPWRRTSGMHRIKSRRSAALVKFLWEKRDQIAAEIDIAPGRLLNDSLLVELAISQPNSMSELLKSPLFSRVRSEVQRSHFEIWLTTLNEVLNLPETEYPELRKPSESMPPTKIWKDKFPLAYARYTHARAAIAQQALALLLPPENLISPDAFKKICWQSQSEVELIANPKLIAERLLLLGARPWQIEIVAPLLAAALIECEPLIIPPLEISAAEAE